MARHRYLVGFATIHLALVLLVCCRDTFGIFAEAHTIFPSGLKNFWGGSAARFSTALGEDLSLRNPVRNAVAIYLNGAGAEAGYGFFAPNVPTNYKLVFELRYPNGQTEYELPTVADAATAFRLESLLDRIADVNYEPMRQVMFQMLTHRVWERHPDAVSIRTVLGYVVWPVPDQYSKGERESFEPVYAYDFTLAQSNEGSMSQP